jgi:hypothetical protein
VDGTYAEARQAGGIQVKHPAVEGFWKRRLLSQIAKPEPSRIVDMVREEIRTPGIERNYRQTNRPEVNLCYEG